MELIDVVPLRNFVCLSSLQNSISNSWSFVHSRFPLFGGSEVSPEKKKTTTTTKNYEVGGQEAGFNDGDEGEIDGLSREDIATVMQKLGIPCDPDEEGPELSRRSIHGIFEEEEASWEELKEAFDVFDENRDGFIDAMELQRVLCILGLGGKTDPPACSSMISAFDENRDGKIDFNEFVKFMENCLI
ncbi:hypothetical protein Nepgr_032064 [Nepenthes gracilis]|uniref:EF-hand domain-containing protein n=1 Tax=Nepenthes gracilis TaxID=150966 RepID=A0AAD3TJB2_NEPGR|nr:hypothetical protein Nepgr_032064 [Nepenthes gracilis]